MAVEAAHRMDAAPWLGHKDGGALQRLVGEQRRLIETGNRGCR